MKTLLAHIDATAPETLTLNGREHIAAFASFLRAADAVAGVVRALDSGNEVICDAMTAYIEAKKAAFPEDYR
jgi:hypothetical protein